MAYSFLGPEDPRPMAVISEGYRGQLQTRLPELPDWERYSLGDEYEENFFYLLHKYLELDTTDTLCYVGDTRDQLVHRIKDRFCLLKPVQIIQPGQVHYAETGGHKMLPITLPYLGAEECFRQLARDIDRAGTRTSQAGNRSRPKGGLFDKILVHDSCRHLAEPVTVYKNMIKCLSPGGILLIVHRPGNVSTLPVFKDAKDRLAINDVAHTDIIRDLQKVPHLAVEWQWETVRVLLPRRKWLGMVRDRYPPQMEMMSQSEVLGGLRELSEGVLKYEGDQVEFNDQLLLIKATPTETEDTPPGEHQYSSGQFKSVHTPTNLQLSIQLPPDEQPPATRQTRANSEFKFLWG